MGTGAKRTWEMTKGDTNKKTIVLKVNGIQKDLVLGDKVYLTVRTNVNKPVLLQKEITTFTNGKAQIVLNPIDTKEFELGIYKYDIQISLSTGEVYTVIKASNFIITEEITEV